MESVQTYCLNSMLEQNADQNVQVYDLPCGPYHVNGGKDHQLDPDCEVIDLNGRLPPQIFVQDSDGHVEYSQSEYTKDEGHDCLCHHCED